MSNNDIGGFFATLGLLIDKPSFETGNKAVDAVTNKLTKLAGTVRNVAVIMGTYAVATSKIESEELKTAAALGISAEKLNQWKTAAKLAKVDANGLVSSMSQMEMSFQKLKKGELDTNLAKQIGFLNIDWTKFEKMDAADRVKTVLESARAMKDQGQAAELINSILGQAGLKFYEHLRLSKQSVDDILNEAGKINFTDQSDYEKAFAFDNELNELKARTESLNKLFGSDIAGALTPSIQSINDWFSRHGDSIADAMTNISELVGKIAQKIAPEVASVANAVFDNHSSAESVTTGGMAGVIEMTKAAITNPDYFDIGKERDRLNKAISDENTAKNGRFKTAAILPGHKRISFDELSPELQEQLKAFESKGGNLDYFRKDMRSSLALQDGIMRPDGTVTQVAPDDWVFAARNVSDLASAFMPQSIGNSVSAPTSYTITQTFNINGNAGDMMPQTIRQQAYAGTQSAIQESISNSARILQFMPGSN